MSRKTVAFSGFLQAFFSALSNLRKFAQKGNCTGGFFRDFCKKAKGKARFGRNGPYCVRQLAYPGNENDFVGADAHIRPPTWQQPYHVPGPMKASAPTRSFPHTGLFPFWENTRPMRMAAMAATVIQFTGSWRMRAEPITDTTGMR